MTTCIRNIVDKTIPVARSSRQDTLSKYVTIIGSNRVELAKHDLTGSYKTTLIAAIIATIGVVNFGLTREYAAPAIPQLMLPYMGNLRLTQNDAAWFGSVAQIGSLFGGILASFTMEAYGRQSTIILLSIPSVTGWLFIMYAQSVLSLHFGRILGGVSAGMGLVAVSVYISEISSSELRGKLGCLIQFGVAVGYMLGAAMALVVNWNYLTLIGQIVASILAFGMMFMPETPRWLIAKGYRKSAVKSLRWLRGQRAYIEYELAEINENLRNVRIITYRELFSPSIRKQFMLATGLAVFQQLCGMGAVLTFCTYIFAEAGFEDSNLVNLIASASQLVSCSLVYFFIDRLGRTKLLIVSGSGMAITCFAFGLYYQLTPVASISLNWLAMVSIFIYFAAFNFGWGGLPFLLIAEISPSRARGTISGVCASIGFITGFLVSYGFIPLNNAITRQGTFWVYSACNTLGIIFVYYFIPETKGKTLEEVEQIHFMNNYISKQITQV